MPGYLWGTVGNDYIYSAYAETGRGLFFFGIPKSTPEKEPYWGLAFGNDALWYRRVLLAQTYGRYDKEKEDIRNWGVPQTSIYYSNNTKMFGIDQNEKYFIGHLAVAAPEIVLYEGQFYIFALKQGSLEGIRSARLKWVEKEL